MIDALGVLIEAVDDSGRRGELLAEAAGLLDREVDGADRAADFRERIVATLPIDHGLVSDAVAGLASHYRKRGAHAELGELLARRAHHEALPDAERIASYEQLYELARGPLADPVREREALEALAGLDSDNQRWRDLLIEQLRDAGDQSRAVELLSQRIEDADQPEERAAMLVEVARLRERSGDLDEAEARVREALELDEGSSQAWGLLRDILERRERPLEALEARVRAAQTSNDGRERVRELFAAAKTYVEVVNKPERAMPLLRELVELDPHHQGATALLVERLAERGELEAAWPHAQRWVEQTRTNNPDDRELNAHAHALAGRCALAMHDKEAARQLLRDAKEFDPRNREVTAALAALELESENWDAALKAYQGLAIQTGEAGDARAQAEIFLRMGQARRGLGETAKANQMVDRALEIDPTYADAARFGVELADSPLRTVEARQRLLGVLATELEGLDEQDERRAEREQQLLDMRLELATSLADDLNRPEEAAVQMRAVLEVRPDDISLLHRALDLFSNAKAWSEAIDVLDRLATLQDHGTIQAKYRYAAVSLMRANNLDATGVIIRARLLGVLEADPLHDKAFAGACELLEAAADWRELSKVLRNRLKVVAEDAAEERVALLDSIAELYRRHLDDKKTAMIAYEQAAALADTLPEVDEAKQADRRNRVISLSVQLGDDHIDKGISQVQTIIDQNPLDYDSYHRLVELYLKARQRDAAIVVSRTLRFLKQADEAELELAAELSDQFQPPRGSISRKQWREVILPQHPSTRLCDLYGLLWPVMAARGGLNHASAGVERGQREPVNMQANGVARWVAYMAQVIDMPPPDLFLRPGTQGGFPLHRARRRQGRLPHVDRRRRRARPPARGRARVSLRPLHRPCPSPPHRLRAAALRGQPARCDLRSRGPHASAGRGAQGDPRLRPRLGRRDQEDAPARAPRRPAQGRRQGHRGRRRGHQGVAAQLRPRGGAHGLRAVRLHRHRRARDLARRRGYGGRARADQGADRLQRVEPLPPAASQPEDRSVASGCARSSVTQAPRGVPAARAAAHASVGAKRRSSTGKRRSATRSGTQPRRVSKCASSWTTAQTRSSRGLRATSWSRKGFS